MKRIVALLVWIMAKKLSFTPEPLYADDDVELIDHYDCICLSTAYAGCTYRLYCDHLLRISHRSTPDETINLSIMPEVVIRRFEKAVQTHVRRDNGT